MNTFRFVNILVLDYRAETARMFTYKIDTSKYQDVKVGMRAIIPFGNGNRTAEGYITELDVMPNIDESRIKEIIEIPDRFIYFDEEMFKLANWMTEKYCCTLSDAFSTVVPSGVRKLKRKERREKFVSINNEVVDDMLITKLLSSKQKENQGKILELLKKEKELIIPDVLSKTGISDSTVKTMIKNNLLYVREDYFVYEEEKEEEKTNFTKKEVTLTKSQSEVVDAILNSEKDTLLKGVTGSGKTEVYIKLTDHFVSKGQNVIILVPEIGLTPQMVKRFEESFEHISIMHSKLSPCEKLVE
ncbi:MAG: DEAD/DEAH box helicase family protein [Clostridia bacterium]|nr:DEAD/DEAH box helicase family protein [Clostridia bacterium]